MIDVPVQELTDFIIKAFNYYNGRINQVNYPARLEIQWANLCGSLQAGYTSLPDKVCINAQLIFNNCENIADVCYDILEVVIHELYHIDQIIDYARVKYDMNYVNYIECAVETQTYLYILQHQQEILEVFGIDVPKKELYQLLKSSDIGYAYHRKRYEDHIIMILEYIFYVYNNCTISKNINQKCISGIMNIISSTNASLIVSINGNRFEIQHGKQLAPIRDINNFFYDNCFKWWIMKPTSINNKVINNNSVVLIDITSEFGNIMATCV